MSRVAIIFCVVFIASAENPYNLNHLQTFKKLLDTQTKNVLDKINNITSLYMNRPSRDRHQTDISVNEYVPNIRSKMSALESEAEEQIEAMYMKYDDFQRCSYLINEVRKLKKLALENVEKCVRNNLRNASADIGSITDIQQNINHIKLMAQADDCKKNVTDQETYAQAVKCTVSLSVNLLVNISIAGFDVNVIEMKFKHLPTDIEMWDFVCGNPIPKFERELNATLEKIETCGKLLVTKTTMLET